MTHLIEADHVVIRYGTHTALAASTFHVPRVGATAVIGPNGSGKSSLLSAFAGLVPTASGTLRVLEQEPVQAQRRLSYVLQHTAVAKTTPITVREAVGLGAYPKVGLWRRFGAAEKAAVAGAMEQMGISHLSERHLHELSGGQRQRVYVAQAMVQTHEVLLLDEPLTGLDLVSAQTIDDLIHRERQDRCSVLLTTHDLDEARAADWVLLVNRTVLAFGPPAEVLTRHNLEIAYGLGALHGWEGFLDQHTDDEVP